MANLSSGTRYRLVEHQVLIVRLLDPVVRFNFETGTITPSYFLRSIFCEKLSSQRYDCNTCYGNDKRRHFRRWTLRFNCPITRSDRSLELDLEISFYIEHYTFASLQSVAFHDRYSAKNCKAKDTWHIAQNEGEIGRTRGSIGWRLGRDKGDQREGFARRWELKFKFVKVPWGQLAFLKRDGWLAGGRRPPFA